MASTKISALAAGAPWQATDLLPIARSGNNFSLQISDLFTSPAFTGTATATAITMTGQFTITENVAVVNRTSAGTQAVFVAQRSGSNQYLLGMDASGGFTLRNAANTTSNIGVTDAGVVTFGTYSSGTATFTAGCKYVVVDNTGVLKVSALGPAS